MNNLFDMSCILNSSDHLIRSIQTQTKFTLEGATCIHSLLRDLEMEKRDPRTVVAIILGGGAGIRLLPLTKSSAKPAVPIGGSYRLIYVLMSNCINSGINKVYILTQFNSASLNRHLTHAYNLGAGVTFGDGYVEVSLAATQTPGKEGKRWFQGTADAVRQFHWLFEVFLFQFHMDFVQNLNSSFQNHRQSGADITLSCLPMADRKGRVMLFSEKPKGDDLKAMVVDTTVLGLLREEAERKPYIASMGVYVFKKEILLNLLRNQTIEAYLFNDYWEDIGTIRSFFEANLALTAHPMYTSRRNLPPTTIDNIKVVSQLILLYRARVVGIRSRINSNVHLKDTVMLGADDYETDAEIAAMLAEGRTNLDFSTSIIFLENRSLQLFRSLMAIFMILCRDCIIDKNARIGKNVIIANSEEWFYIRSGISIILKNSPIKDGVVI
ncbi:hypothetical protein CsSME_00020975 [Camellia sinensis var. sinensis]